MSGKNDGKQQSGNVKPKDRPETSRTESDFNNDTPRPGPSQIDGAAKEGGEDNYVSIHESFDPASETKLEIGLPQEDTDDAVSKLVKVKQSNPKITISGPVSSPCKVAPELQKRCPIYFGIKSYIHDFYHLPDKETVKNEDYIQEDDFRFLVEPGKRRWHNWWLRVALWVGVNLMLLGVIALLVGHLTAPRQPIVHQKDNFTVLDRWAVAFNNRLIICQLAGLAAFTSGAVVVMLALLISSYPSHGYYVMTATVVPEAMMAAPQAGFLSRIPLTGSVRGVQPTFVRTG